MPALIRRAAPNFTSAPTGGYTPGAGAQYAEAGQWNRAQYDQRRQTDLIDSGMKAFGGAAKSYFDNQGEQQRTAEARQYQQGQVQDHRQYAEQQKHQHDAELQKHRDDFLTGLSQTSPETINDPAFRPFGAGIASGALDPTHAMTGYEAVKKSMADQAAKAEAAKGTADYRNRSLDLREQGQSNTRDYQQGNLEIRGRTLGETINQHDRAGDQRDRALDQGQERNDISRDFHARPKVGAIVNDPTYREQHDRYFHAMNMAKQIGAQLSDWTLPADEKASLQELRTQWLVEANSAAQAKQARNRELQQVQRSPQSQVPTQPQQAQPASRDQFIDDLIRKGATDEEIAAALEAQGIQQ